MCTSHISTRRSACLMVLLVTGLDAASAVEADPCVTNRPPLKPAALIKLPIGSIQPDGWLLRQLRLQADGFHGHLTDLSAFLKKEGNAWLDPLGAGDHGWEEVPYWLKGYLNCALVLRDERMLAEARIWIDAAIASQQSDGWFGPDAGRTGVATDMVGRDDLWPNMVMLACLQDWHDATGDPRVIELMTNYFRYLSQVPDERYLLGYWAAMRGGDNLASIYWLYNRTGHEWLLELAAKNHRKTARWDQGVIDWHNVNVAQAFDEPAIWWLQSHNDADLQAAYRNWNAVRNQYGQMPGGMFAADENAREGCDDPRQAVETCGMVEAMLSHESLLGITGDVIWADRCEDVAFNSLPAALTADLRALRYLTACNLAVSDDQNHSPGIQNGGAMFQMNPHDHRCCQHNVGHGWPYYAQHLWFATPDGGLAAALYSACTVTARVGPEAGTVTIRQDTNYPFEETIRLTIAAERAVRFPLWLRVPKWCERPALGVNDETIDAKPSERGFVRLERDWQPGDRVTLELPADIRIDRWERNKNSVSIRRGPLTYSLQIAERFVRSGGTDEWPAVNILPDSPWNFGLVLGADHPAGSFELVRRDMPKDESPWTPQAVPLRLRATGRIIPEWRLDRFGLVSELQSSPVRSDEPDQPITLIPMGAARLRIASFPVIGRGPDAAPWSPPPTPSPQYQVAASHVWKNDAADAVADALEPRSSADHRIPRHTFWPNRGTEEWIEAHFDAPREVRAVRVYWFDDTGSGKCRVPASWRLLCRDGQTWRPVETGDAFATERNRYNTVNIAPITTDALRVEIRLQDGFSAGVLELKVE